VISSIGENPGKIAIERSGFLERAGRNNTKHNNRFGVCLGRLSHKRTCAVAQGIAILPLSTWNSWRS
jgi:hypothetical protein